MNFFLMQIIKVFCGFILLLVCSCAQPQIDLQQVEYYIEEHLNSKFNIENDLYIFLPSSGCKACIKKTIDYLFSLSQKDQTTNIHIIPIGYSKKKLKLQYEGLENKYDVIYDVKGKAIKENNVVS